MAASAGPLASISDGSVEVEQDHSELVEERERFAPRRIGRRLESEVLSWAKVPIAHSHDVRRHGLTPAP
jgi:hypothetical protein